MPVNSLFPSGTMEENRLVEGMIVEAIRMYGKEWYYIPRTLVAVDDVLGEDNLSKFKSAFMIEAYLENFQSWGGAGSFISKFGMVIEEQGEITIARRRWEELVGMHGATIIPDRPCEGDLLYFPTSDSLFEIKFVEHQSPFYQLGKLNIYKLKLELFQYSSERIETDIDEINKFALDMTFDVLGKQTPVAEPTHRDTHSNTVILDQANSGILDFTETNPFGN